MACLLDLRSNSMHTTVGIEAATSQAITAARNPSPVNRSTRSFKASAPKTPAIKLCNAVRSPESWILVNRMAEKIRMAVSVAKREMGDPGWTNGFNSTKLNESREVTAKATRFDNMQKTVSARKGTLPLPRARRAEVNTALVLMTARAKNGLFDRLESGCEWGKKLLASAFLTV